MALLTYNWKADTLLLFIGAFTIIYFYLKRCYAYWDRRGFKTIPGAYFILGHFKATMIDKLSMSDFMNTLYKSSNEPFEGIYGMIRPMLFIRDPELIQSVLIKDFSNFMDRGVHCNEENDPLSGHLFTLPSQKWKKLRSKLTPTFTSGKLKAMFSTLVDCGSSLQTYLEKLADSDEILHAREISGKYTTNVIASVAFGIDIDTINNPNNDFRICGRKIFEPSLRNGIIGFFMAAQPNLLSMLGIKHIDEGVEKFIKSIVTQNLEYREQNNVVRKDFFQMLIQLRKNGSLQQADQWETDTETNEDQKTLTLNEIAAQAYVFFVAGFEPSSATLSFCLYELAKNQHIQQSVHEEIDAVLKKHDGKITYDSVSDMKFLECCIDETLRKYAVIPFLTRTCMNDYKIPGTNKVIEKGVEVIVPAFALQRDEQYYEEPEEFKPERFNEENSAGKTLINRPYLPFGDGPRNCIALRMGKMQTKVGLILMLQHFRYELNKNHKKNDLKFDSNVFVLAPADGINLHVKRR